MASLPSNAAFAVARKDLAVEGRSFEQLALVGLVAFLVMLLFEVAAEGTPVPVGTALWVTVVLAATAGLSRSFHAEADEGTLELLVASPASPASVYFGKVLSSFAVAVGAAVIALIVAALFFGTGFVRDPAALALLLVLGALGLAALTAFFSAASAGARARSALFPVLVLPLALPLMLWAARGTVAATAGVALSGPEVWLNLAYLAAYDALVLGLFAFLAPRALSR